MSVDRRSIQAVTPLLASALKQGAVLSAQHKGVTTPRPLTIARIGSLTLRSGKLIAGDVGMGFGMHEVYQRRVPPRAYDVLVSIWGLGGRGHSPSDGMGDTPRAAYLALQLSPGTPAYFEFAATGERPWNAMPDDDVHGIGVDVGGVGFLDADDLPILEAQCEADDFMELADQAYDEHPEWSNLAGTVQSPSNPPIAIPSSKSGWGDGSYFSYWGLDSTGKPIVLIIDFDLDGKWEH